MATIDDVEAGIKLYESHLMEAAKVFNEWAAEKGVPVEMDPRSVISAVKGGTNLDKIAPFWSRHDDTGIVHETQIKTAIDCIHFLLNDPKRCGHVVGAMQSGKTTASFALQWAGPILYLLTGKRVYPFYIIGNQTGQEDQTKTELDRFLSYYGHIDFRVVADKGQEYASVESIFKLSPNLATYRGSVLRGALEDVYEVPSLEDLVHRRVGGTRSLQRIVELTKRAKDQEYLPLMIIDEPQFGASDHIVVGEDGVVQRKCVLAQIFDQIEGALGTTREDHWFVGLSATPFELNDLQRVWQVRQYLTEAYSGFNFFNGSPISPDVEIAPPVTLSQSKFAQEIGVPFLAKVVMAAYDCNRLTTFTRYMRKVNFEGSQAEYRSATETALRETIYALLERYKDEKEPVGLCIRAFNDNAKTEVLISRMGLDPNRIEVIEYYGSGVTNMSIKRVIARRARPDLPYVIFVTNRARMADAFPTQVRFFMDFGLKAADLNSLLQGLLGRACGYNKKSTVVLSDASAGIVDAYVATTGGYVHKTSRHSIPVGGYRRGAPTGMLKISRDMDDEKVRNFFREIDEKVVKIHIKDDKRLSATRQKGPGGFRTGPILLIAEEIGLFDHIEAPEVRARLFPQIPTGFNVARRTDEIIHSRGAGVTLRYSLDEKGNCRFTFRWSARDEAARGGAAGRAKGKKDVGQHMEPTIYVEKYLEGSGEIVYDRMNPKDELVSGAWRAFMVTFPLREPVSEVRAAKIALPTSRSPYSAWTTEEERIARDSEEARRKTRV